MKQYKVRLWLGVTVTEVVITARNSANALSIAKRMYPSAIIINAK